MGALVFLFRLLSDPAVLAPFAFFLWQNGIVFCFDWCRLLTHPLRNELYHISLFSKKPPPSKNIAPDLLFPEEFQFSPT